MPHTLWLGEEDREKLYESLGLPEDELPLKEYGHSYRTYGRTVPILTGVLENDGYVSRLAGEFVLENGMWIPKPPREGKTPRNFVVAKKSTLKSLYDIDSKERFESGTHFLFGNHPVYGPSGMYFTTRDAVASMDIESLTRPGKRTRTLEDITGKHRIELAGSTDDDLIYRAFLTYHMSGYMVRFDPGTNKPPLLVYEKNPVRHAA